MQEVDQGPAANLHGLPRYPFACLIVAGIGMQASKLPTLIPETLNATSRADTGDGLAVRRLLVSAGLLARWRHPHPGIEAVSNNVQSLAEPRVATGKWTMFYMAVSLSFTAGGIILLYLLWECAAGQTDKP